MSTEETFSDTLDSIKEVAATIQASNPAEAKTLIAAADKILPRLKTQAEQIAEAVARDRAADPDGAAALDAQIAEAKQAAADAAKSAAALAVAGSDAVTI